MLGVLNLMVNKLVLILISEKILVINLVVVEIQLDLDNQTPSGKLAVENIYFLEEKSLKNGVYKFRINQWSARNSQGFKAEN